MDSLTHLVAGALTPLAFRGTPKRAAIVTFGIAAGELPDIDVFFGNSVEALLTLHRGITHALFWQPVFVLVVVLPFFLWLCMHPPRAGAPATACAPPGPMPAAAGPAGLGRFTLGKMYIVALVATATHIYLDCMTTFGTQAFLPFSDMRVGLPAMFIVDLALTVPAIVLLVMALRSPPEVLPAGAAGGVAFVSAASRRLARVGLAWLLLYPMLALGINTAASHALWPVLAGQGTDQSAAAPSGRLTLMTEPFSPLVWKAIVDEGPSYRVGSINLAHPERGDVGCLYDKPDMALYEKLKAQHPLFVIFASFSPLMVQTSRPAPALAQAGYSRPIREYSFVDLRYIMAPGSVATMVGRTDPNFVLEARVNDTGALVAWRFLQRGKDAGKTPWTVVE